MLSRKTGWESARAALVVGKPGLRPQAVEAALGLKGTTVNVLGAEEAAGTETVWTYHASRESLGVEQQIADLAGELLPLVDALKTLANQGFRVRVDISGFVKTNSPCKLEASTIALVAQLGIPLSFTTRVARSGESDSDWLDSILG
ncbi:DUF4279 domain-containing protein [Streptomyces sp. ET3-23]|uniref:DUF4279 domain-containing protein n=1 Tax=Streptomyces sp. ET3-23 TaxID=2885643 RepID=UPI001D10B4A3|nr:DUF4279 domain-containing protein [Streptomyces sp. ET3-23]MCC2278572.1 DUF4279 domain-containing protein [Streptomyces sp. ET3-23]